VASTDILKINGRHCAELSEVVPVTKHQVMKAYGGVAVKSTPYLIHTVDRNEWSASGHDQFKADSHIACRAHAAPMLFPCHAVPLIHTSHPAPLPCSDNAVSFVKVRVVTGNIRTASPSI